ncbi:9993_t:CDS:2 [Ambispora gerdemannii]|uniref:Plasma membrane fusion protein PRM1 n=1 Tax=Ambispora gerdemannii TaxID=144530 RepID=A0A9N8V5W1_9GLOM|nr:9993_t:CDS:2 [Ambispora gerdemannii]
MCSLNSDNGKAQNEILTEGPNGRNSEEYSTTPYDDVTVKPYIGLLAKLSTAWIAYPIISLFFIAFRLLSAMSSINPLVDDVKQTALRSCDALEVATSTMTSLPHYMAGGFNRATIASINFTIKSTVRTLDLAILALEGIILWIIDNFRGTYRCLLEFAIRGSMAVVTDAVNTLTQFTNGKLNDLKNELDKQVSSVNSNLDDARKAIQGIGSFTKINVNLPTISIPATNDLSNFKFPDLGQGLEKLNTSLPTMDVIDKKLDDLVSVPFDNLRKLIKDSTSNMNFNDSVLPVPQTNQVAFCANNLDLTIIDNIARDLIKAAHIGLIILVIIGLLLIAANAVYIWFSHRRFMIHVDRVTATISLITVTPTRHSTIELIKIAEHPLLSRWFIKTSKFFKNKNHQNLYRWFWDYISQPTVIVCLLIGVIGVLGVYLQIALLDGVRNHYRKPLEETFNTFGNAVMSLMNSELGSISKAYSNDSNKAISGVENDLNRDLLGWVNTTTTTLNSTLNVAVDDLTSFITNTFNGAPVLLTVAQQLVNCLVLVKIRGIQNALTFIKDNAFIGLPRVNDTILMVSPSNMQEVVNQATDKLIGSKNDDSTGGEIGKLFDKYENILRAELPLFWILIASWGVVLLMGLIRVLWFIIREKKDDSNNSSDNNNYKSKEIDDINLLSLPRKTKKSSDPRISMISLNRNRISAAIEGQQQPENRISRVQSHINRPDFNFKSSYSVTKSTQPTTKHIHLEQQKIISKAKLKEEKSAIKPFLPPKPIKVLPIDLLSNENDNNRLPPPLKPKPILSNKTSAFTDVNINEDERPDSSSEYKLNNNDQQFPKLLERNHRTGQWLKNDPFNSPFDD